MYMYMGCMQDCTQDVHGMYVGCMWCTRDGPYDVRVYVGLRGIYVGCTQLNFDPADIPRHPVDIP